MYRKAKYIIVKGAFDLKTPILFPDNIEHKTVAQGFEVISAGFVVLDPSENGLDVFCSGESISLGIKSNPATDEKLIWRVFQKPVGIF